MVLCRQGGKERNHLRAVTIVFLSLGVTGNGYMDGNELQGFIQELQQARQKAGLVG